MRCGHTGFYFDGPRDKTAKGLPTTSETELHFVVLSEPGGFYVTCFRPRSRKAIHLAVELHAIIQQYHSCGSGGIGGDGLFRPARLGA